MTEQEHETTADIPTPLADLINNPQAQIEPLQVVEADTHPPKRKRKTKVYLPNLRLYLFVIVLTAATAGIVAGLLLVVLPVREVRVPVVITAPPIPYPSLVPQYDPNVRDWSNELLLSEPFNGYDSGTPVHIVDYQYDGFGWHYTVMAPDGTTFQVREYQLIEPLPDATPTARFGSVNGAPGYPLLTTVDLSPDIPANTRVRISSAWYDGAEWHYDVVAEDENSVATAAESQLTFASEATLPPPVTLTPTPLPTLPPG
jgi:hypothetical protein